jgi:colanic acid biosynthesis protein WcaM
MQDSSVGPALKLNFDLRKDVRGRFMARQDTLLSLANIKAVNEKGQSSVDIDRIDHQVVNVQNLNFRLPAHSGKEIVILCDESWRLYFTARITSTAIIRQSA